MPSVRSVVAPVAAHILVVDLPALPVHRRDEVVGFVCTRVRDLPDLTRAGVLPVAVVFRWALALPGGRRLVTALMGRPIPPLGEYVRLVRSLATAYVWETWPDTAPDGTPSDLAADACTT